MVGASGKRGNDDTPAAWTCPGAVYRFLHGSGTKAVLAGAKETKLGEFSAGAAARRNVLAGWELEQKFSAEVLWKRCGEV